MVAADSLTQSLSTCEGAKAQLVKAGHEMVEMSAFCTDPKASFHTVLTHFSHPKALGTLPAIWNFWFVGALWKTWKRLASRLECHDCCTNFWTVCYIYKRQKHIRVPEEASGLNSATQIWVERIANLNAWEKHLDPSEVYQHVSSFAHFAPRLNWALVKKRSHLYRQRRWGPRRGPPRCCSSSTLLSQPGWARLPSGWLKTGPFLLKTCGLGIAPWKSQIGPARLTMASAPMLLFLGWDSDRLVTYLAGGRRAKSHGDHQDDMLMW